ncbi:MAG: PSD1 and planctomycete cytochrome C domain-containing protein [Planctomycetia bacterium]|nr:PSD1 and planctomycete cytochrome C domain-containing protein [Planctomycetia bacterium]
MRRLLATAAIVCLGGAGVRAATPDFVHDIRPLLEKHCYACHAGEQAKSGLRLDLKEAAFNGGDGWGAAIVPGKPDDSPLVQFARGDDPDLRMPPKESDVPPLAASDIERLVAWVNAGADWPDGVDTATVVDKTDHWAFKPVRRPAVPVVHDTAWPKNDIDRFILARLEAEGLTPAAEADRRTWLRRVTFDLTGLPTTPEEVEQFAADTSPGAHGRVIERLLASPRYGERYAQHWLDVVRYADTHGYEVNTERPNAWPYRDYCISAFNADLPYDQFVREQIAGGEPGKEAATGFLVAAAVLLPGQIGADDVSKRAARQDALNDIIVNTSDTVLGLTVGCARCHDHKFDPITARDYYSLQAFFAGVEYGERMLETPEAALLRKEHDNARERITEIDRELPRYQPLARAGHTRPPVTPHFNTDRIAAVSAQRLRFTILDTNQYEPCIDELEVFDSEGRNVALATAGTKPMSSGNLVTAGVHELEHVNDGQYGNGRSWMAATRNNGWVMLEFKEPVTIERIVWGRDRTEKFKDRTATAYRIEVSVGTGDDDAWTLVADSTDRLAFGTKEKPPLAGLSPEEQKTVSALEREKAALQARIQTIVRDTRVFAGSFKNPHPVHLLNRGDAEQRKEELAPGSIATFAGLVTPVSLAKDAPDSDRRQALATWLTDPKHPLPARVMANRIWQWHFGTGLVDTPNDFGRNGSKATHPELLDWLADEFVASGWSIKHMHRLIMGSATFRQASTANPAGLAKDADARLLWRFPPRRLEAETIRDTMLAVSGRLNLEMGGRGFNLFNSRGGLSGFPPIESFDAAGRRRMIYAHKVRMERDDVFGAFDCPDAGQSMARRRQSTTPIQALNLFNSPFTFHESQALAARIEADVPTEPATATADGDLVRRQIDRVFQLAFTRAPDALEMSAAEAVVREHGLSTLCRVIFNSNEFLFVP